MLTAQRHDERPQLHTASLPQDPLDTHILLCMFYLYFILYIHDVRRQPTIISELWYQLTDDVTVTHMFYLHTVFSWCKEAAYGHIWTDISSQMISHWCQIFPPQEFINRTQFLDLGCALSHRAELVYSGARSWPVRVSASGCWRSGAAQRRGWVGWVGPSFGNACKAPGLQ